MNHRAGNGRSCKPGESLRMNSMQFIAAAVTVLVALSGCSGKLIEGKKIDYKSAGKVNPLTVPPDLSAPPTSDRYAIPETAAGSATYSEYSEGQGARHAGPTATAVLPASEKARIERGGSQRWLVVEADAETCGRRSGSSGRTPDS